MTIKIVISGGPCAGKTSAMGALRVALRDFGVSALFVPEAATDLIMSGIAPWTCESMLEFQTRVIALQLEREAEADAAAESFGEPCVIVCDRGICDSRAYLADDEYAQALEINGLDEAAALTRYDSVFLLESIAKSNPQAYSLDSNGARFENAEEAVLADERTARAWSQHLNLYPIAAEDDFGRKVEVLLETFNSVLAQWNLLL